jgi:CMP-2-keto-3-deoxyoctulosonic acid synthetase
LLEAVIQKIMKRFNVKFHGENFLLNLDGEFKKFGFYATSFIKAETPLEAKKIATILIHQNPNLRDTVLNVNGDRPRLNIEEIEEVKFLKSFAQKSTTQFTFYPEDEK